MPYSIVISYSSRMNLNDCKYTVFDENGHILNKFNDKYEFKLWLGAIGMTIGKRMNEKSRVKKFNIRLFDNLYKIYGIGFLLA